MAEPASGPDRAARRRALLLFLFALFSLIVAGWAGRAVGGILGFFVALLVFGVLLAFGVVGVVLSGSRGERR